MNNKRDNQIYEKDDIKYDVELILSLNEEYSDKRLASQAPSYELKDVRSRGLDRAQQLKALFNVKGKRVLEIGCGMGETAHALAAGYGCEVCGVDLNIERSFGISESEIASWLVERKHPNLSLRVLDVSKDDYSELGQFDLI